MYNGIGATCLPRSIFICEFTAINSCRISYIYISIKYTRGVSYCFSLRRSSCHRSICNRCIFGAPFSYFEELINELFDRAKERDFPPGCPCFLTPVYFVLYYNIRCLSLSQAFQPCAKLVTLLQSVNLLCPETRVKGPVPIDSLRFQALMFCIEP